MIAPQDNHIIAAATGVPTQIFTWDPPASGAGVTFYRLTVESAGDASSAFSPTTVEIQATGGRVSTSQIIPPALANSRIRWSVRACNDEPALTVVGGPPGNCGDPASRTLTWSTAVQPPQLLDPLPGARVPTNSQFRWRTVSGASAYLFCIARPGVACPTVETASNDVLVVRRVGNSASLAAPDLSRFRGASLNWTAGACGAAAKCVYQQNVRPVTVAVSPDPVAPGVQSANLILPGHRSPSLVRFRAEGGRAIFQGDIDLGPVDRLEEPVGRFRSSRRQTGVGSLSQPLSVRAGDEYLWPGGIVPYELDSNLLTLANQDLRSEVQKAIDFWNDNTNLRFVPSSDARVFIRFVEDPGIAGSGQSRVGRRPVTRGSQPIRLKSSANSGTVIHEIGHAIGLWHEQSRRDRDGNVQVLLDNVLAGEEHNFDQHLDDGIDFGPYDTTSTMHYARTAFARRDPLTGQPLTTIRSRIPGVTISPSSTLSALDIAGINRLYPPNDCGRAPILFENDGKGGKQVSLQFSEPDLDALGLGDKASSICVPKGWTVDLFEHTGYGGASLQVVGPAEFRDLKREKPNGRDWGDTISSARVSGAAANPPPNSCQVAAVFEHHNYRGREMRLTADVAALHQVGLGDNITSVCVPDGVTVQLFEHTDYRGDFLELTGPINVPHLRFDTPGGEDWNDTFSSVRLSGGAVNAPPPACQVNPVLFADDNFRGERIDVTAQIRDLHQLSFGDKASSLCIPAGWSVTLFQNKDFGGQSLSLGSMEDVADLKLDRPGGQDWGDTVSSVQVTPPAGGAEVTCASPVLFEHDGFQGRQFPLLRDTGNLHPFEAGDRASSACVPAQWSVVLFEHQDFGGASLTLTGPTTVRDMKRDRPGGQDWGDRVSSVRVTPPAGTPPFTACTGPILYHDDHYRGRSFTVFSTVNDLHAQGDGDEASSLCVPPGFSLTLFEHKNLTGKELTLVGPAEIFDLKRDRPEGEDWGDRISSVRVN